jgi:transcriptional regulator with XRE-family HTH domain
MTENGEEKITFSARLKEKRIAKGWSQHYLASLAGCTNSNISYLESHPGQKPKLETVEGLAAPLDWPINEARRLAGYRESDDNLTPLEVEEDFRLALFGFRELSEPGREMVKKQIAQLIDFVSKCEQTSWTGGSGEVPDLKLGELDKRAGKKKSKKK